MKKKTRNAILITAICVSLASAGVVRMYMDKPQDSTDSKMTEAEPKQSDVAVNINTEQIQLPEYKEITDEVTGETVMAEVQVNEPIEQKSTTSPEKPKSEGTYTNPNKPPEYKQEQTVIEQKPKNAVSSNSTVQNQNPSSGKVYVDGFGYVDKAGETKTQTGVSDGDINKMVGSMD